MEKMPNSGERTKLDEFVNDLYDKVDFLFQRQDVPGAVTMDADRYCEINLTADEIAFVQSAFTDNFVDPPQSVELALIGRNPNRNAQADCGGIMITAQHSDADSIYTSLYTVWIEGPGAGNTTAVKDTRRATKLNPGQNSGMLPDPRFMSEIIFEMAAMDPSEQSALAAMVARL